MSENNDKIFDGDAPKYPERAADPNYIPAEAAAVYAGPPTDPKIKAAMEKAAQDQISPACFMAYAGPQMTGPNLMQQMAAQQTGYDMVNPNPMGFVYAGPGYKPGSSGFLMSDGTDMMAEAAKNQSKEFKFCMECGAKNKRTNKFCTDCGTPFPPEVLKA